MDGWKIGGGLGLWTEDRWVDGYSKKSDSASGRTDAPNRLFMKGIGLVALIGYLFLSFRSNSV